jgi:hypothetical protein
MQIFHIKSLGIPDLVRTNKPMKIARQLKIIASTFAFGEVGFFGSIFTPKLTQNSFLVTVNVSSIG